MINLPAKNKLQVNYFQRRPRTGFSFSIESIFEQVRELLADKVEAKIFISRWFNNGYFTKFGNVIEAAFRQTGAVNHITGEIHFINLLMNPRRVILTIHDCGMMTRKAGLAKKIVRLLYLTGPVKKSRLITTVSQTTKNEIIMYTGCDPEKIKVIPVAVNDRFTPFPKLFNKEKPVILHIGTGYNKNLLRLISAVSNIKCHLKIIGDLSGEQLAALRENHVDFSNEYNISNERLLENYQKCDILSFVSTFEGFGMPIIEANAVERAVITSNISSMPEVANNAACLVDPFDVNAIRTGLLRLINDEDYRIGLINNGRINKLRFDPNHIANQYYEAYLEISRRN